MKMTLRNNHIVPVDLAVYEVQAQRDTDTSAVSAMTTGAGDVSNTAGDSPLLYPQDIPIFNELWAPKQVRRLLLEPGRAITLYLKAPGFVFEDSLSDTLPAKFQTQFNTRGFFIRVMGTVTHSATVASEQGYGKGGVDIAMERTYRLRYDAGAEIKFIHTNVSGLKVPTGGAKLSNKPLAGIQELA
jgi:hypothetical protein